MLLIKKQFNAYMNMFFKDHGFIRYSYMNMRPVVEGKMYRSAQPAPVHIKKFADKSIKTIINLRGERLNCGSYILEKAACEKYGITLVNFPVSSRNMPEQEKLHKLAEIFDSIEYPALMHCKSGADRAGLAGVLYQLCHEKESYEVAIKQLSLKYGHIKQAKTGMLDYFFALYKSAYDETQIDFFDWVDNVYNYEKAREDFFASWWASIITDKILKRE